MGSVLFSQPARWLQMWEIPGAGGISTGTSPAAREDSDWLQPGPGGPVGSEHTSSWAALPGQTGTWLTEQSVVAWWFLILIFLALWRTFATCSDVSIYTCLSVCVCVCVCAHLCVWFLPLQQLESLVWERSGNLFVSSHNDGSYSVWAVTNGNTCNQQPVSSTIPYGEKCIHHTQTHTSFVLPS